jgi:hypothetical protein
MSTRLPPTSWCATCGTGLRCGWSRTQHGRGGGRGDIVTTVTADKRRAVIVHPDMIEAGMHINAVGGDCPGKTELHRGVLEKARVVVEFDRNRVSKGKCSRCRRTLP